MAVSSLFDIVSWCIRLSCSLQYLEGKKNTDICAKADFGLCHKYYIRLCSSTGFVMSCLTAPSSGLLAADHQGARRKSIDYKRALKPFTSGFTSHWQKVHKRDVYKPCVCCWRNVFIRAVEILPVLFFPCRLHFISAPRMHHRHLVAFQLSVTFYLWFLPRPWVI